MKKTMLFRARGVRGAAGVAKSSRNRYFLFRKRCVSEPGAFGERPGEPNPFKSIAFDDEEDDGDGGGGGGGGDGDGGGDGGDGGGVCVFYSYWR